MRGEDALSTTYSKMSESVFKHRRSDVVHPRLTVGTAWRVPHVGNTDDRHTGAAWQHLTGEPLKHRLSSKLSDLRFTTIKCYSIYITNVRCPPLCWEKSVEDSAHIGLHQLYRIIGGDWRMAQRHFFISVRHPLAIAASSTPPQIPLGEETPRKKTSWGNQLQGQTPSGKRGIINAAPDYLGGQNPE